MARWMRFTTKYGVRIMVNMDQDILVEEVAGVIPPAFTVCGKVVEGDIDALALQLEAVTFAGAKS